MERQIYLALLPSFLNSTWFNRATLETLPQPLNADAWLMGVLGEPPEEKPGR